MWQQAKWPTMLVLVSLLGAARASVAADITVSGNWTLTIGAGDLAAGPGSDLIGVYLSSPSQILVSVPNLPGHRYGVDVRRVDSNWPAAFQLDVRRTGKGTGNGTISGGDAFQPIGLLNTRLFTGVWQRFNVPLQLRLSGVSVRVPADTYVTNVVYTVIDL